MTIRPLLVAAPLFAACVTTADEDLGQTSAALTQDDCGDHRHVRLAWLGNDPGNTYDNANLAAATAVATAAHGTVTPYYAGFDATTQLAQCQDAVRSHRFDAILAIPDDSVGIVACVTEAHRRRIPVVATDLPVGPDLTTVEPQVPGEAGAVLTPASQWGVQLSAQLVTACAGKDPCNVAYIAGAFGVAFDDMALADLGDLETAHPSIHLVATDQAFYDQATAYGVAQQMAAAHPDLAVIVGAGDQMAEGAEHALADAGKPPGAVAIIGAGGGAYAIQAVLDGRWYATYVALPADEGQLGAVIAIRAARRQPIADPGIDPVARRGFPAFFTAANQGAFAGFTPQWPG